VRLGPQVARLGMLTRAGRELATVARPLMERLAAETGETVTLAVPAGGDALTVAQADGGDFVSSGKWLGMRTALHCTADGKVLLAFHAVSAPREGLVRRTDRTIVNPGALERELVGLAAPVREGESVIAALCVSGPGTGSTALPPTPSPYRASRAHPRWSEPSSARPTEPRPGERATSPRP
jgi:DNA-binding IclR family transcriptional regulator